MTRTHSRHVVPLLLGACLLLGATGCAGAAPSASDAPTTSPTAEGAVVYPMPDLGPSPAPAPLDADRLEALRIEQQDQQWQGVVATYPSAVRPADPFREYRDEAAAPELVDCLEAAGIPVDIGTDADGEGPAGLMVSPVDEAESVASFTCWSTYPTTPIAPMTTEQIDYLYSYLTEYLVPCYEANGATITAAPSRADFVSQWPQQGWFPTTAESSFTFEEEAAIEEACVRPA